jgi:hypothetical protein
MLSIGLDVHSNFTALCQLDANCSGAGRLGGRSITTVRRTQVQTSHPGARPIERKRDQDPDPDVAMAEAQRPTANP